MHYISYNRNSTVEMQDVKMFLVLYLYIKDTFAAFQMMIFVWSDDKTA